MDRKDFFEIVAKDYFKERSTTIEELKTMITSIMPVFGELKVEVENKGQNKIITFIDLDEADMVFIPKGYNPTEKDLDMTCTLFKLTVDNDGIIKIIEHGHKIFTYSNKDIILFLGSLLGKKIIL